MKKISLLLFITITFFLSLSIAYFDYLHEKKSELQKSIYEKEVKAVENSLDFLILTKKKATLAIAISLSNDATLIDQIKNKTVDEKKYKKIIKCYKNDTLYKNIWIQILDKDAVSLYRSWTDSKGDSLHKYRPEMQIIQANKNFTTISIGRYDLSIKSIVPIVDKGISIGAIEVISHFNSIANLLEQSGVNSVFVVKEKYKKQLRHPFTKLFIGDFYIANYNAKEAYLNYLQENRVKNYFHDGYRVENNYLIISSPIRDINENILAYSIMFKKLQSISTMELEFFVFKYISLFVILVLILAIGAVVLLFFKNQKQKVYYNDIIDSSTNIVLVSNGTELVYANEIFFKYFTDFNNIKEFSHKHICICDFFENETGYLQRDMDGVSWLEYLLSRQGLINKVKIILNNKSYVFTITVSLLKEHNDSILVILQDISAEEKLLNMSVTDELTGVWNRRYYNQKIDEAIKHAKRYENQLSLIMLDIDKFKNINDIHGHDKGDLVLKNYTQLIQKELRGSDIFCRVGGEEFAIILPHTDKTSAKRIAEKLRVLVAQSNIGLSITMSFGVVEYRDDESADSVYKRADTALYFAKENGRNMVVMG